MKFHLLALALLAACGGGQKTESKPPAGMAYKDMSFAQRKYFMEHDVLPTMKAEFAAFDARYQNMNCNTCHGEGSHDGTFKMPNPKLPVLPGTEEGFMEWVAKDPDAAKMSKFMAETVTPKMAAMLGMKAFDPATHSGDFSCDKCHTLK